MELEDPAELVDNSLAPVATRERIDAIEAQQAVDGRQIAPVFGGRLAVRRLIRLQLCGGKEWESNPHRDVIGPLRV